MRVEPARRGRPPNRPTERIDPAIKTLIDHTASYVCRKPEFESDVRYSFLSRKHSGRGDLLRGAGV